jgi:hypothetical protein
MRWPMVAVRTMGLQRAQRLKKERPPRVRLLVMRRLERREQ